MVSSLGGGGGGGGGASKFALLTKKCVSVRTAEWKQ